MVLLEKGICMNKYTINAAKEQLKAMNCIRFKVGIFCRTEKKMINKNDLVPDSIINLLPFLMSKNMNNNDIYITQASGIDRALILVDDLDRSQIAKIRFSGMAPACVVETSPRNFQAWISLGPEPMPMAERSLVAKRLAEEFGGDKASADANHYGRLAGFTNRKENRRTSSGAPFVLCWEATGEDAEESGMLRDWAKMRRQEIEAAEKKAETPALPIKAKDRKRRFEPGKAFSAYFSQWLKSAKSTGTPVDLSRGDFAIACRMLTEGYDDVEIEISMKNFSPDILTRKANHVEDYINRTIKAAYKRITSTCSFLL